MLFSPTTICALGRIETVTEMGGRISATPVSAKKSSRLSGMCVAGAPAWVVSMLRSRAKDMANRGLGKLENVISMLLAAAACFNRGFMLVLTEDVALGNEVLSIVFRKANCRSICIFVLVAAWSYIINNRLLAEAESIASDVQTECHEAR